MQILPEEGRGLGGRRFVGQHCNKITEEKELFKANK